MFKAALILLVILAGCSQEPVPKRVQNKQERIERAKIVTSKTPEPKTYTINGSQLLVVDVPTADSAGFIDFQKCFVWRDSEFKMSSLSCPSQQDSPELPMTGSTQEPTHN